MLFIRSEVMKPTGPCPEGVTDGSWAHLMRAFGFQALNFVPVSVAW